MSEVPTQELQESEQPNQAETRFLDLRRKGIEAAQAFLAHPEWRADSKQYHIGHPLEYMTNFWLLHRAIKGQDISLNSHEIIDGFQPGIYQDKAIYNSEKIQRRARQLFESLCAEMGFTAENAEEVNRLYTADLKSELMKEFEKEERELRRQHG